jgi:membrane associated rhomboid family serine protease
VHTLVPIFPFIQILALPAALVLGFWFVYQFFSGFLSLGIARGGVAWWAHIGGFVFGMVAARLIAPRRRRSRAWVQMR